MRTGKIKVIIDSAEHPVMKEHFQNASEALAGLLDVTVDTLPYGDYWLKAEGHEPLVVTFKETADFQRSFYNGHLMEEILAINIGAPNSPKALVIAKDEHHRVPKEVHMWVSSHWRKRNFLIPTFKFGSREDAVGFMVDCAMKIDRLQWLDRKVSTPEDYNSVVGQYSFYGVGREKAEALQKKYPKPIDLYLDMLRGREFVKVIANEGPGIKQTKKAWRESRWWYGILGETTALRIEGLILDGKDIPKRERGKSD